MNEFTILAENKFFGEKRSKIFKNRETLAAISDWAIASGGFVSSNYHTIEGNELKYRTGYYWTSTANGDSAVRVVR